LVAPAPNPRLHTSGKYSLRASRLSLWRVDCQRSARQFRDLRLAARLVIGGDFRTEVLDRLDSFGDADRCPSVLYPIRDSSSVRDLVESAFHPLPTLPECLPSTRCRHYDRDERPAELRGLQSARSRLSDAA